MRFIVVLLAANLTASYSCHLEAQTSQSSNATLPTTSANGVTANSASTALTSSGSATTTGLRHQFSDRLFPILSYLKQRHIERKARLRASPLGELAKGIRPQLSQLTGGLVPAVAKPNIVELQQPGPAGSAAKIKLDQLQAPQRIAAIQELAKVDCNWYHEAQFDLIAALRTDRVECVRYEAALALSNCNCCSQAVVQALKACVAGSDIDGNPKENSARVRDQAAIALENCLGLIGDAPPTPATWDRPEVPYSNEAAPGEPVGNSSGSGGVKKVAYYEDLGRRTVSRNSESIQNAQDVLSRYKEQKSTGTPSSAGRNLTEIWKRSK